jgi:hypothetical protein
MNRDPFLFGASAAYWAVVRRCFPGRVIFSESARTLFPGGFMRNRISASLTIGLLIASCILVGCTKTQMAAVSTTEWTKLDSGAYAVDGGRMFYGIGRSSGLHNATLLRATADNQAQVQLGHVIESYLRLLTNSAGMITLPNQGQQQDQVQETVAVLTESALKKARISDHRYREAQGSLLSLCSLDLSTLKQVIQTSSGLSEHLRQRLLSQADQVYAEYSAQQSQGGKIGNRFN